MDLCYYCFAPVSSTAEVCGVCGAPTFTLIPQGKRPQVRRIGGAIRSDSNGPTARRVTPSAANLPRKIDLRANCTAVEDQGQLYSCCANAAVGAFEHYLKVRGKPAMELSRLFVYYTGRRAGGRLHEDKGVRVAEVMGALVACGAPDEKRWPYLPEKVNAEPPQEVFDWAFMTRPTSFASVSAGDGIRGALAHGFPVVVNLCVGAQTYGEAARTGVLRAPTAAELAEGPFAHALLIVGYDLDKDEYTLRNSWGSSWGDEGYCRAAFSTIDTYGWPDEYWILGNMDELDVRPAQVPTSSASAAAPPDSSIIGMGSKLRDDIRSGLTKDIEDSLKDIRERLKPKPPGQN